MSGGFLKFPSIDGGPGVTGDRHRGMRSGIGRGSNTTSTLSTPPRTPTVGPTTVTTAGTGLCSHHYDHGTHDIDEGLPGLVPMSICATPTGGGGSYQTTCPEDDEDAMEIMDGILLAEAGPELPATTSTTSWLEKAAPKPTSTRRSTRRSFRMRSSMCASGPVRTSSGPGPAWGEEPPREPVTVSSGKRRPSLARSLSENSRRVSYVRTGIIFDWDDTLMPTTWLIARKVSIHQGIRAIRLDSKLRKILRKLEQEVLAVLSLAQELGSVAIVTNAEDGWVQDSAKLFMPKLLPVLEHVRIISARACYSDLFVDDPMLWKAFAFRDVATHMFRGCTGKRQLVSIGDGECERDAAVDMAHRTQDFVVKSVKLYERPNHDLLRQSLRMLLGNLADIVTTPRDLDIMLTSDPKAPDAF